MTAVFADAFYWPAPLRLQAAISVERLLASPSIQIVAQTRGSFLDGLRLYRQRQDKNYSMTDCISMETMRRERLTDALTNDRHFEQEGFRALFRA